MKDWCFIGVIIVLVAVLGVAGGYIMFSKTQISPNISSNTTTNNSNKGTNSTSNSSNNSNSSNTANNGSSSSSQSAATATISGDQALSIGKSAMPGAQGYTESYYPQYDGPGEDTNFPMWQVTAYYPNGSGETVIIDANNGQIVKGPS